MANQHTPGPWKPQRIENPSGIGAHWNVLNRDGDVLARLTIEQLNSDPIGQFCPDRRMANAYLIAAAPELLKALTELADEAERCDSWQSFPRKCLDKAWAVVAKAKGGAQ